MFAWLIRGSVVVLDIAGVLDFEFRGLWEK